MWEGKDLEFIHDKALSKVRAVESYVIGVKEKEFANDYV